jgi:putative membrane protein
MGEREPESSAVPEPMPAKMSGGQATTELAMRRTGLAFQRTRIAADRTLMAVIRTALSLISFGFAMFSIFKSLRQTGAVSESGFYAVRNFGASLIVTGIGLLILGLVFHLSFMRSLRKARNNLIEQSLLHGELPYPVSLTAVIALVLLVIGLVSLLSIVLRQGPFQ